MATTMYDLLAKVEVDTKAGVKSLTDLHGKPGETEGHAKTADGGIAGFISAALPLAAVTGAGTLVVGALNDMVGAALESNAGIAQITPLSASWHNAHPAEMLVAALGALRRSHATSSV